MPELTWRYGYGVALGANRRGVQRDMVGVQAGGLAVGKG
jgi:hypothetical protein